MMRETMVAIIDKHMEAAFEEMQRELGDTPRHVTLHIMQAYDDNGIDSQGVYQCCSVSLGEGDEQPE